MRQIYRTTPIYTPATERPRALYLYPTLARGLPTQTDELQSPSSLALGTTIKGDKPGITLSIPLTIPKDSSKPSQPPDALAQKDARLAVLISSTAFIMFAMLLWDRPFPSPDFYSFAKAAQDIVLARPTESKYPPGLSLLLIPFIPLGINAQVIAAQAIGVLSALGFAWSLFALCRHLNIPAGSPCIALTLFNRYTIQSAMSGTAHTPFLFLSTSALISAAHKRWALAYTLASASTLFRYNGVLLPLLVGVWHFTTLKRKGNEPPMRQFAIPAVCVALCLVPPALWITLGTTSALGMYAEEVAMRGTAG
ncbi:MAG: hypothetical protein QXI19_12615, partial [Candidatus Caldarchaeum sp.]